MLKEEWRDVVGYEGLYQVSNLGRIKSLIKSTRIKDPDGILRTQIHNGYVLLNLYKDSKQTKKAVHRIVCEAFHPNPKNKKCVNHKDFNRQNNCADNLEWCTYRENIRHRNQSEKYIDKFSSKYFGVCWDKEMNKWYAGITQNRKQKKIGYFESEYKAHLAYEEELKKIIELN